MSLRLAVVLPFLIGVVRSCGATPPITTTTAGALRESVGVNLHLEYDDTPYADPQRTLMAMRLVGLAHARDAAMRSGPDRESRFSVLARAGVRFDLFVNQDLPAQLASAERLAAERPGAVDLLEGPNEANHEGFGAHPGGDARGAQAYQERLEASVRESDLLSQIPVAGLTYWPPLANRADWANFHAYPATRRAPAPQLTWMRTMAAAVQPRGSPVVCTETGYTSAGADSASEPLQAALIPILVLENYRAHVRRTYLYELFDEHSDADPLKPDRENHFGLFRADGRPKLAALAMARFIAVLAEPPGPGRHPTFEAVRLSGGGLRSLEVARSDGARATFAWWEDAQRVTRRALQVRVPSGSETRSLDLATGESRMFKPGSMAFDLGASPVVFIQTPSATAAAPPALD